MFWKLDLFLSLLDPLERTSKRGGYPVTKILRATVNEIKHPQKVRENPQAIKIMSKYNK
jgi:hypothetical protein